MAAAARNLDRQHRIAERSTDVQPVQCSPECHLYQHKPRCNGYQRIVVGSRYIFHHELPRTHNARPASVQQDILNAVLIDQPGIESIAALSRCLGTVLFGERLDDTNTCTSHFVTTQALWVRRASL